MKEMKEEIFHYPELKFINYCKRTYGINRGVFNVIDEWFYEEGFIDIVQRRRIILDYLKNLSPADKDLKFGSGGVKRTLQAYIDKQLQRV